MELSKNMTSITETCGIPYKVVLIIVTVNYNLQLKSKTNPGPRYPVDPPF